MMNNTIKIVAVISSSKFHGNTATLVREVLKALTETHVKFKLPSEETPTGEQLVTKARQFHAKCHVWTD